MIDLHCHILPGVDDGSSNLEESVEMAKVLEAEGFRAIAPSPHYGEGPGGDVPIEEASQVRASLAERLAAEGINLELLPNAEHHVSPGLFERIGGGQVMPIGGQSRWLLTELPWRSIPGPEQILFRVRSSGYNLLLAHPERYSYIDFKAIASLAAQGVKMQCELGSFVGVYGRRAEKLARKMADKGLVHVLASDLHRAKDAHAWLGDSIKKVRKRYGDQGVQQALEVNPRKLLDGAYPEDIDPISR